MVMFSELLAKGLIIPEPSPDRELWTLPLLTRGGVHKRGRHPFGFCLFLSLLWRYLTGQPRPPMHRYLISTKSSMPYLEPSRPMPDSLTPPKGATSVEIIPSLMPTMPYSSASATRQIRPMSRA